MKFNVKGLMFVGFAAAILSANAFATDPDPDAKVVTSKAYTDATYQAKIGGGANAGKVVIAGETAGSPTYTTIATAKTGITTGQTTIPTSGAVADAIADANSNANGRQTASSANYQVGGAEGAWVGISNGTYTTVSTVAGTGDDPDTMKIEVNATTDGALSAAGTNGNDFGKLVTAGAVKTYVDNTVKDGTLTITVGNGDAQTFTANASSGTSVTVPMMSAETAEDAANGVDGLVTAATYAERGKFLKGDGTWAVPQDTTYTADSTTITLSNGQFSATTGSISENGTNLVNSGTLYTEFATKQDKLVGAAKVNNADSLDKDKLMTINANGEIQVVNSKISNAAPASGSGDVITSGAVYTAINGKLIPTATGCSAQAPCALVATGTDTFSWVAMSQPAAQ